jgi:amino acid transporter
METLIDFMLTFAVLGGMAFLVAQMSKDREIGFWTLFVVSVFLTPFIGIFVALLSKRKRGAGSGTDVQSESIKETQSKFWERFMPKKDEN